MMNLASNRSHCERHIVVGSARIPRRASRRLRMESMEGRLMLATTVTYFTPEDLTPAQISFEAEQTTFTAGRFVFTQSFREGGFIVSPFSPTTDSLHSLDFDVVGTIDTPQEMPASPAGRPMANSLTNSANININVSTNTDTNLSAGLDAGPSSVFFGNSGLQPAVISSLELTRAAEEVIGPVFTASNVEESSRDEGGPISIAAVLTGIRPLESLEPSVPAPSQLAVTTADDSPTVRFAGLPGSADRQISGELARATVFEIAGGEPASAAARPRADHTDLNAEPRTEVKPNVFRPVSYQNQPGQPREAVPERVSASATDRAVLPAKTGGGPSFGVAIQYSSRHDEKADSLDHSVPLPEPEAAPAGIDAADAIRLDAAHAEAFERLGEETDVAAAPRAINLSWRGALNATPLLMILALERIAASNSRRANRHEAFVSTRKALGRGRVRALESR